MSLNEREIGRKNDRGPEKAENEKRMGKYANPEKLLVEGVAVTFLTAVLAAGCGSAPGTGQDAGSDGRTRLQNVTEDAGTDAVGEDVEEEDYYSDIVDEDASVDPVEEDVVGEDVVEEDAITEDTSEDTTTDAEEDGAMDAVWDTEEDRTVDTEEDAVDVLEEDMGVDAVDAIDDSADTVDAVTDTTVDTVADTVEDTSDDVLDAVEEDTVSDLTDTSDDVFTDLVDDETTTDYVSDLTEEDSYISDLTEDLGPGGYCTAFDDSITAWIEDGEHVDVGGIRVRFNGMVGSDGSFDIICGTMVVRSDIRVAVSEHRVIDVLEEDMRVEIIGHAIAGHGTTSTIIVNQMRTPEETEDVVGDGGGSVVCSATDEIRTLWINNGSSREVGNVDVKYKGVDTSGNLTFDILCEDVVIRSDVTVPVLTRVTIDVSEHYFEVALTPSYADSTRTLVNVDVDAY